MRCNYGKGSILKPVNDSIITCSIYIFVLDRAVKKCFAAIDYILYVQLCLILEIQ